MKLLLNGGLILGWGVSLALSLGIDPAQAPVWLLLGLVLLRTQLQTGLFIVAHDALHGLLFPTRPRWNQSVGAAALMFYAGLPFGACRRQHQRHHSQPASSHDPDFPQDRRDGVLAWYRQFLSHYLSPCQMLVLLSGWALLVVLTMDRGQVSANAALLRVLSFATLPLLLSSLQLFVFGTYLPHRVQRPPTRDPHPLSLNLPPWLSLLACFHFGYHREHHDNPALSWFELPGARALNLSLAVPEALR